MKRFLGIVGMLVALASSAGAADAPPKTERATTPAAGRSAPRRLEDIHIEGQMPAPQVLFITARDQRRFRGFHHGRYVRSARAIGGDVALPTRLVVPPRTEPVTGGER